MWGEEERDNFESLVYEPSMTRKRLASFDNSLENMLPKTHFSDSSFVFFFFFFFPP